MTRRKRNYQQIGASFDRPLSASKIRHEHRNRQSGELLRIEHDVGGVGKLRQKLGRHERSHFDFTKPYRIRVANPFELSLGGKDGLDALQAVAQSDFADHDPRRQG